MPQAAYQNFVSLGPIQALGVSALPTPPQGPQPPQGPPQGPQPPPTTLQDEHHEYSAATTEGTAENTTDDHADQCP